jgi:OmcA/MtrC family decaheme c-type cytochrome
MNVFIHRIHMGEELPSVQTAANAGPWIPEAGRVFFGATRSAFVGVTATTPPEISEFSEFAMPNPIGRCDQCHLDDTWATPPSAERAPVVRRFKRCVSTVPSWAADTNGDGTADEPWCNNTSTSGPATVGTLYTPPVKAVCTSCHDSLATDAHADMFTQFPMSQTAVESCADCHGEGALYDALKVHAPIP